MRLGRNVVTRLAAHGTMNKVLCSLSCSFLSMSKSMVLKTSQAGRARVGRCFKGIVRRTEHTVLIFSRHHCYSCHHPTSDSRISRHGGAGDIASRQYLRAGSRSPAYGLVPVDLQMQTAPAYSASGRFILRATVTIRTRLTNFQITWKNLHRDQALEQHSESLDSSSIAWYHAKRQSS